MNDSAPRDVAAVLESLEVPRQRVLYVQASADWLQRAGLSPSDTLGGLREWVGDRGTLVMPSYPFDVTHREYAESRPQYDVRRTPSGIGLLPEILRRTAGAVRSLDPDFCVTALGADAREIVGTEPASVDPFGPDSSYQRMLDRRAVLVGMGVSLNTNSFIHLVDARAEAGYPSPVYADRLLPMTVVDADGRSRDVLRKVLRPEFQRLTAPAAIVDEMAPTADVFATLEIGGARFFKWELGAWSAWCLAHAARQSARRAWPCWLSRLAAVPPQASPRG